MLSMPQKKIQKKMSKRKASGLDFGVDGEVVDKKLKTLTVPTTNLNTAMYPVISALSPYLDSKSMQAYAKSFPSSIETLKKNDTAENKRKRIQSNWERALSSMYVYSPVKAALDNLIRQTQNEDPKWQGGKLFYKAMRQHIPEILKTASVNSLDAMSSGFGVGNTPSPFILKLRNDLLVKYGPAFVDTSNRHDSGWQDILMEYVQKDTSMEPYVFPVLKKFFIQELLKYIPENIRVILMRTALM